MERIENNQLFLCTLKEILRDFNLPLIPVLTEDTVLHEGRAYIKDNWVVRVENGEPVKLYEYVYNMRIPNLTKNFIINSSVYDEYTHRYLGEYLRFLRDYHKYDLMGMYNCFYGEKPRRIYKNFKWKDSFGEFTTYTIDTDNDKYNYYIVPIKFDQEYTIAIGSQMNYEIMAILYNDMFIDDSPVELFTNSYKVVNGSQFNNPFIYKVSTPEGYDKIWSHEKDLKILLKIPKMISSSMVILEGNFKDCTSFANMLTTTGIYNEDKLPTRYISRNSLLDLNFKDTYYLSDKLVEYVLCNVIDSRDWISQNVTRVRDLTTFYDVGEGVWTDKLRDNNYSIALKENTINRSTTKVIVDSKPTEYKLRYLDGVMDFTGYVDKDFEYYLEVK